MRKLLTTLVLPILLLAIVPAAASAETVRLGKGQTLRIRLTENPSTGYAWKVTSKPKRSVLKYKRTTFKDGPSKDADGNVITGAPGKRYFYWRAVGSGTTTIVLKEFPPGGGKASATKRYTVKVR